MLSAGLPSANPVLIVSILIPTGSHLWAKIQIKSLAFSSVFSLVVGLMISTYKGL